MNNKPKRVLVCGGRHVKDARKVYLVLDDCSRFFDDDFVLIEGGAIGVDLHSKQWAIDEGIPVIEMRANWDYYPESAGPIRNGWMLKYAMPDLVIAIDGGAGTKDMVKQARKAGVITYEV